MPTRCTFDHAESVDDVALCFPVMRELRPHLADAQELVRKVSRMRSQGYRLLAARRDGVAVGLAGYRLQEMLVHGPFVYVDDLVVTEAERRTQLGAKLLDEVGRVGRAHGCERLVLDTALTNVLGQRFYFRYGMLPRALRFSYPLTRSAQPL